jgi:hypothetical protein
VLISISFHGSTQVCTAGSHGNIEHERHTYMSMASGNNAAQPRVSETLERASPRLQSHNALLLVHLFVFTYIASPPHHGARPNSSSGVAGTGRPASNQRLRKSGTVQTPVTGPRA